jgi:hypothetical protein
MVCPLVLPYLSTIQHHQRSSFLPGQVASLTFPEAVVKTRRHLFVTPLRPQRLQRHLLRRRDPGPGGSVHLFSVHPFAVHLFSGWFVDLGLNIEETKSILQEEQYHKSVLGIPLGPVQTIIGAKAR